MIFGFRRAYSIFSADHLRHMTISNLFSKLTIIKCSRNKVATNREALHISLFYSPICDYPQRTSFVWWQQTNRLCALPVENDSLIPFVVCVKMA